MSRTNGRQARCALAATASLLLAWPTVGAERPQARLRLTYTVAPDAQECPTVKVFRDRVAVRLGYDPFVDADDSSKSLLVDIRGGQRLDAELVLRDGATDLGRRTLSRADHHCDELVSQAAFAASVAIDPAALRGPQAPKETPSATKEVPAVSQAPAASTAKPTEPFNPVIRVGPKVALGALPSAAFGMVLGASLRRRALSFGVEGRFFFPTDATRETSSARDPTVVLRTSLATGAFLACGHAAFSAIEPYLCATVSVGAIRGESSQVASPRSDVSPYVAAGPRAGVALVLTDQLRVDAGADVPLSIALVRFRVDDRVVWTSPLVSASFGLGVSWSWL